MVGATDPISAGMAQSGATSLLSLLIGQTVNRAQS